MGLRQKAAETYSNAVRDIYKIEAAKENAKLKAKHAGAGIPVATASQMAALSDYVNKHPGDDQGAYNMAGFLKIPAKAIISSVTAARAPIEKRASGEASADANKAKADEKLDERTVYKDGKPFMLAPSPRLIKPAQDRLINYEDAEESLKGLLKSGDILPTGDAYNRAVLAVAATTTANASDATTTHEANTLKNYGLVSKDAVKRTLEHIQERKKKFLGSLEPLKGKQPATETKTNTAKAPPVDQLPRLIQQAKDRLAKNPNDSVAKKFLDAHDTITL